MVNPYEAPPVMAEFADRSPKPPPFPWAASFWAMFGPIIGTIAAGVTYDATLETSLSAARIAIACGVGMAFFSVWLMAMTQCLRWYWR
jgi:hypothetical protein